MFYEKPEMEIVLFEDIEVVTDLSNGGTGDGDQDDWSNLM